jgi:hypothetical protein
MDTLGPQPSAVSPWIADLQFLKPSGGTVPMRAAQDFTPRGSSTAGAVGELSEVRVEGLPPLNFLTLKHSLEHHGPKRKLTTEVPGPP